ncbi:LysR family transcriptional regulator [Caulobacter segnis]|uniref:LysR family transcriptional regulator n=1 Tax=Caulobacter segnis TaxID=88688 RepID=UPI0024107699|nr:LysR family transcriptional regulator [Caulobacter segnis]MDG2522186.1 LysR family transcriptional regulator [Caulobacter segnis]
MTGIKGRSSLDTRQMRQVIEICRAGSFGRAAETLGVSQPTLSRSIARLEDEIGVVLFDRSAGAAKPTAYARYLARHATKVLTSTSALVAELRRLAVGESGRLRVGLGSGARAWLGPLLVERLLKQHPGLALEILSESAETLYQRLEIHELDVVIASAALVPIQEGFVDIKIGKGLEGAFVVRAGHPILEEPGPHSLRSLLRWPIAHPRADHVLRRLLPTVISPEELRNLTAYSCNDDGLLQMIGQSSDAIVMTLSVKARRDLEAGRVVRVPIDWTMAADMSAVVTAEQASAPVVKGLVAVIEEIIAAEIDALAALST